MQLGFILDQSRCIGCHACTVACKSENDVPVGNFRTWVKYTETGAFPEVKRSFTVLRCNQCTQAPCVTICPVSALEKRPDGIVDLDQDACVGCKACMQGCPYDALYLNEAKGTAEKCHFCAHRTEIGLAPACAVVCPTEAIIPGDFDDPDSLVSRLRSEHELTTRKAEAGTGPNVYYREGAPAGLDPLQTNPSGGYLWADRPQGPQMEAAEFEALQKVAEARTTYDVAHPPLWSWKITGYLFTKSIAAGVFLAGLAAGAPPWGGPEVPPVGILPFLALAFLALTTALLVFDLKRPERFYYLITRGNWSSWLVKGTYVLMAYGLLLTGWVLFGSSSASWSPALRGVGYGATAVAACLAACYTAWLFGQAKGRVLWMRRGLWFHLIVQAVLAGSAVLILLAPVLRFDVGVQRNLVDVLLFGLLLHLILTLSEDGLAPRNREKEYHRASNLITRGPYARLHWSIGLVGGVLVPLGLVVWGAGPVETFAALLALIGLWVEEDIFVRAGQALSIS